jgi:hypothetical protein
MLGRFGLNGNFAVSSLVAGPSKMGHTVAAKYYSRSSLLRIISVTGRKPCCLMKQKRDHSIAEAPHSLGVANPLG